MDDGYWIPGRWNFGGYGYVDRDRYVRHGFDRDDFYRGRDFDRHDRDRDTDRDRDHDRFRR
jgi:hypothetical protein